MLSSILKILGIISSATLVAIVWTGKFAPAVPVVVAPNSADQTLSILLSHQAYQQSLLQTYLIMFSLFSGFLAIYGYNSVKQSAHKTAAQIAKKSVAEQMESALNRQEPSFKIGKKMGESDEQS